MGHRLRHIQPLVIIITHQEWHNRLLIIVTRKYKAFHELNTPAYDLGVATHSGCAVCLLCACPPSSYIHIKSNIFSVIQHF